MSTTTKSPKKVVVAAFRIAARTLPAYAHRFSPKKFTQPQLFACLVLKTLFKTDYRGIVTILSDCSDLTGVIRLKTVPHYTTLHKASQRLLTSEHVQKLLETTIDLLLKDRTIVKLAALDATGLESGHISPYFYKVRSHGFRNRKWTHFTRWPKAAVVGDTFNHSILAILTTRGPGRDSTHFKDILSRLPRRIKVKHIVADAGYDAEANHIYANEVMGIKSTIPPKVGRATEVSAENTLQKTNETALRFTSL